MSDLEAVDEALDVFRAAVRPLIAQVARERDEALARAEQAERERDEALARAEQAERERDEARKALRRVAHLGFGVDADADTRTAKIINAALAATACSPQGDQETTP